MPYYRYLFEPAVHRLHSRIIGPGPIAVKNPTTFVPPSDPTEEASMAARTPGLACDIAEVRALLDPVVIWLVRNPFDVIASLRLGLQDGWGHGPRPPWWEEALGWSVVQRSTAFWVWINDSGYREAKADMVVRYEDLVSDTSTVVSALWEQIEFPPHPGVLRQYDAMVTDRRVYQAAYQDRWAATMTGTRIGWGRRTLVREDLRFVEERVGELAATFGYT